MRKTEGAEKDKATRFAYWERKYGSVSLTVNNDLVKMSMKWRKDAPCRLGRERI